MPAWRPRPDWLREAVLSALDQRGADVELLVVDDGSLEPVADMLRDIDDPRLRLVRVAHGGVSHARNAGIEAAAGDYLRFIDCDDVIDPVSTARLLGLAAGADDVIAYGATLFCTADLLPVWKMVTRLEGEVTTDCLLGRFAVRPQALLFPRAVIDRVGGWDSGFEVSEDWDFVIRALEHATVRGSNEVATYYRKHGGGEHTDLDAGALGARRVISRYFERHPDQRGTRLERQANASIHAQAARSRLTRGQVFAAVRHLILSVMLAPGATVNEVRLSLPALVGHLRTRSSRRRHGRTPRPGSLHA